MSLYWTECYSHTRTV